jgi:hypothetical protein
MQGVGCQPETDQTCDRCGPAVRAVYGARRDGELYLCRSCANRFWSALCAQGWTIGLVGDWTRSSRATAPDLDEDPRLPGSSAAAVRPGTFFEHRI